jgi:hypothetical protein
MSTITATSPAQTGAGNKFSFTTDDQSTQAVFYPSFGPIVLPGGSARLEYNGDEGNRIFAGDEIRVQDSPLGKLISVIVQLNPDAGVVTFTLMLPPITGVTPDVPQTFDTIAVKSRAVGFMVQPGAQLSYSVLCMHGTAESVEVPL